MSTTPNILIDVSCPSKAMQDSMFQFLCGLDTLNANSIGTQWENKPWNQFLHYGQFHIAILNGVDEVRRSTNPIHISNGLLADSFVFTEGMQLSHESAVAPDAIRFLKREALGYIRIIHVHLRCSDPGLETRRMALNLWHASCVDSENERWLTCQSRSVDQMEKDIHQCLKEMEPKPEAD